MTIVLRPQTQKLLEEQMKKGGFATADEAVHTALRALDELRGEAIEDLDEQTQAALDRALAQSARGEGRPWADVRAELAARYLGGKH
jgi:Arc/MetJ-type ribon-helix-helix transcriptional regulator